LQRIGDTLLGLVIGKGAEKSLGAAHKKLIQQPHAQARRKHLHGARYRAWLWSSHKL
jgi:hypothetical protein